MNELPPDPPRLRAILAHLDRQLAETETIGTYLRLQRDAVQAALANADAPHAPAPARRPGRLPKGGSQIRTLGMAPSQSRPQFVVQQQRTARGPQPSLIHTSDCTKIDGPSHPIGEHDARAALTDPNIEPCSFCRPDTELGMDVA